MAQTTILALGDSLTEGNSKQFFYWSNRVSRLWQIISSLHDKTRDVVNIQWYQIWGMIPRHNRLQFEIHNYGISGDKTSGMLDRLPSYLSNHKYQLAIVLGGKLDFSLPLNN